MRLGAYVAAMGLAILAGCRVGFGPLAPDGSPGALDGGAPLDGANVLDASLDAGTGSSDGDVTMDAPILDGPGADVPPRPDAGPRARRECLAAMGMTEQYGLPAPSSAPPDVTFAAAWETLPTSGGFSGRQAMDDCRVRRDLAFTTWHGRPAVRVEVNPGDDPIGAGDERAELLWMQDATGEIEESTASGVVFIASSYFFPLTWAGTYERGNANSWSIIQRLFPVTSTAYSGTLFAGVRETADGQRFYYVTEDGEHPLADPVLRVGEWVDFVLELDFGTGATRLYRRNQGEVRFRRILDVVDPTLTGAGRSFFKQGLYRGPDVAGRTDVLWMGPAARGATFAAVERAAFGTSDGS